MGEIRMNTDKSTLKELNIGEKTAQLPIIQGGMGVGISRSSLAGAVAREGGIGVISTAQIGYDEEGFEQDQAKCNRIAIGKHVKKAKEIAGGRGLVGVNIMVALKHYEEHVRESVKAGADVIISGAGLPMDLPKLVSEESGTKIAPIVSSRRAANLILKMWAHRYDRTADFIVIEGPKAGGHLGFSREQLADINALDFDEEICRIIECKKEYEEKFDRKIPVIVAGGIFDRTDIDHVMELGADGVQIASRFVATEECDLVVFCVKELLTVQIKQKGAQTFLCLYTLVLSFSLFQCHTYVFYYTESQSFLQLAFIFNGQNFKSSEKSSLTFLLLPSILSVPSYGLWHPSFPSRRHSGSHRDLSPYG